ncbi:MAG: non-ribosomal peptide synthetase, partial [Symploca sp. SIO2E6]|nr:non-ribosomal peptide synthetase [Symploca sp. SIO2E6]
MSNLQVLSTSHIQQANWFLYKFNSTSLADKISVAIRMTHCIDIPTVRNTIQILIKRHPILRSIYFEKDGNLISEIRENVEIYWEAIDGTSWDDADLNEQLWERQNPPFNLEYSGVFRACLFKISATENILLLTLHQIAGDRESLLILIDEFVTIYNDISSNLPPLNTGYTDYVNQELEFINSQEGKQIGDYWQEKLGGELPILELPTSLSRPSMRTYNGAAVKSTISPKLTQKIQQLAKTLEIKQEEIILAVFKVLLYRYTGEEDLLVGLLQGRESKPLFAGAVGNITNIIVVRSSISESIKFTDFLEQVSKAVFDVKNYRDYPYALLVKQLKVADLSHYPICQVAFGYHKSQKSLLAKELEFAYYELPQQKVDFELSLEVTELPDSLSVDFKYNSDVLEAKTVTQIAEHFQNLLTEVVANPETPVGKLSILSEADKQQILVAWNNTKTDYPQDISIHQLFESQVEKTPDAIAVIFQGEK